MWRKCNCGECEYCLDWKRRKNEINLRYYHGEKGKQTVYEYNRSERGKNMIKKYFKTERGKQKNLEFGKIQRKKFPIKTYAREKFIYAVKKGNIKRENCQLCEKIGHGHHPDYLKPFEVNWLCPKHHSMIHKNELGFEPPTKTYGIGA
jgi:hypothetical protein